MQTIRAQNTAILIFANSAAKDRHDKNIDAEVGMFAILTQQTLKTVQAVGLPYFHFTENEQIGETFGERFTNAIASVYEKGFENIITIGNDSPQLKSQHLKKACRELQQGKTVLGPAMDGGFYLMGINRAHFDRQTFAQLPWQKAKLFGQTKALLENVGASLFRLPVLYDLDSQNDVVLLASFVRSISRSILRVLRRLLAKETRIDSIIQLFYINRQTSALYNKGSPTLLFI